MGIVENKNTGQHDTKPVFIKFAPLLDPSRYLLGRYDEYGEEIRNLPTNKGALPIHDANLFNKLSEFKPFCISSLVPLANAERLTPVSLKTADEVGVLNDKRCNTFL